jgi:hypothetical protein
MILYTAQYLSSEGHQATKIVHKCADRNLERTKTRQTLE